MPNPYVSLLRTRGGPAMSAAGFVARLPLSMAGIALLLLVVQYTDSYAVGGSVQATWVIVEALVAPLVARLIDRVGQWQVVGPQTVLNLVFTTVLIVVIVTGQPRWTWFVAAALAGAALPVIGSLVRARWAYLLGPVTVLRTAYSWESVVDEVAFVLGPPAATIMAVALGASTALAVTILIGATGTVLLLVQRRSQPPARGHEHHEGQRSALLFRGMPMVFGILLVLGVVFAGVEVTVIAIARESGRTGAAGIVLAVWALSSLIAGLVVGGLRRAPALPLQMQIATLGIAITLVPLLLTTNLVVIGAVLFVAGFGVSPSLIAGFSLVEQLVPSSRLTEGLTWVTAGISIGFATGSPVTGLAIDRFDPAAGFKVALAAAVAATVLTRLARPTWAAPDGAARA